MLFSCVVLLVIVAGTALGMSATGALDWRGPRADYFLYLTGLIAVSAAFYRWPPLAACLLMLALVEFGWGMGSFLLDTGDGRIRLLPDNRTEPMRFQWHALLQAVPKPQMSFVSSSGLTISHTSEGTRGPEPVPSTLEGRIVIAAYGGSSAYDIAVSDRDTWGARLGEALGANGYYVVNNGVPGYTTAEHVLQTAFYQRKFGRQPACAIYYVGWNDLRNAHIVGLDQGYADFHMPSQVDSLRLRRVGGSNRTFSPILTVAGRLIGAEADTVRYGADPYTMSVGSGPDSRLYEIFERNVRTISAINRGRGVTTIWVGQLINRVELGGEGRYGWLPLVRDRDIWPMLEDLRGVLAKVAGETGDGLVNLPIESFGPADFADNGHFSVAGARRFAEGLLPIVRERCR